MIQNENVEYYKGIYNGQVKIVLGKKKVPTNKNSYQENPGKHLSLAARAGLIYRLHNYFYLVYIGAKLSLHFFKP